MLKFFSQPAVGLDISDDSIKYLELSKVDNIFSLGRWGEIGIPLGVVDDGELKDPNELFNILQYLRQQLGLRKVNATLSGNKAHLFNPLIFEAADLDLSALESYGEVLSRTLSAGDRSAATGIINFDRHRVTSLLIKDNKIVSSSIIDLGGENIIASLQKNLRIDRFEAERLKRLFGLSRAVENRDIFYSILPITSVIKDEIEHQLDLAVRAGSSPSKIILVGSEATIPGFLEYFGSNFRYSVTLGNPWVRIYPAGAVNLPMRFDEALNFTAAIGSALHSFD